MDNDVKIEKYELLVRQVESLLDGETNMIANMANVAAVVHAAMGFWWTGFYLTNHEYGNHLRPEHDNLTEQLILGPFQGPPACTRIPKGRGVCGTAWQQKQTVIVPDVEQFAGHIACSSESKSEIVIPMFRRDDVYAVLDIDSRELNTFDEIDKLYLEKIVALF